jgi:hypothetical protein
MDAVKKALRKIRHKFKRPEKIEPLWVRLLAEAKGRKLQQESWERDKKNHRDASFAKARLVRQQNLEEQRLAKEAEAERQGIIAETRTKNLKKARRRLRWLRKQEQ